MSYPFDVIPTAMSKSKAYNDLIRTRRWRSLRAEILRRRPLCADCESRGVYTPATEVHHIRPLEGIADTERMKTLAYDPENLVPLCHECHRRRHEQLPTHAQRIAGLGSKGAGIRRARNKAEVDEIFEKLHRGGHVF